MNHWTIQEIPDQSGRVAIVTGANSGIGFESAQALAAKNATVILACRNISKGEEARQKILDSHPTASLEFLPLDLNDLNSVSLFSKMFQQNYNRVDILINNAGVMAPPLQRTKDGFEAQFGVNHLGHFALTGLLLTLLLNTAHSRVVTTTSFGLWFGWIDDQNLNGERFYSRYIAYCQSKLANLMFAVELQRRLQALGADSISLAAHPGLSETNLQTNTSASTGIVLEGGLYKIMHATISQRAEMGALPLLFASASPEAKGGRLYGPNTFYLRGYPVEHPIPRRASAPEKTYRLWEISEKMTGIHYQQA